MKAALYVRVSTHFQIDKDSLPMQREELVNYSRYALGINDYELFEDAGYSAKNTDRPAYQDMMARVRQKEFTHIIVWKIDRVSRNLLDFATMYEEIKKHGVTFVSKNEQFDTSSAMGEAMLKIILIFAELERKLTGERVYQVMLSRAEKGLWNGATVPLGYDWSDDTKFPIQNESEANIVKYIYDLYYDLKSTTKVALRLNREKVPTKRGGTWTAKTINDILRNPFYIGTYRYNVKDQNRRWKNKDEWVVVENNHPPIIDRDIFNKVQCIIDSNFKGDSQYQRENIHTHIFSGLIYCGKCGTRFWAGLDAPRKDSYRPSRYTCYKQQGKVCTNFVSDVTLLPFMLNYIANFIRLQERITQKHSLRDIERMLLRGDVFNNVAGIDKSSLEQTYLCFVQGFNDEDYNKPEIQQGTLTPADKERDELVKEKEKYEKALLRLQDLYLYSEESMSQKDYLFKKRDITAQLERIDERLKELNHTQVTKDISHDLSWTTKASYFLMTQELEKKRHIDYREVVDAVDAGMIQSFMQAVIEKIYVADKKIISITFKNGLEHTFAYKEKPTSQISQVMFGKYEDKLLKYFKEKDHATSKDIRELTGLSRATVTRLLDEFINRGIITRLGNSVATYYILSDESKNNRVSS